MERDVGRTYHGSRLFRLYFQLLQRFANRFRAIQQVLEYRRPEDEPLVMRVSILMYNFHLLHYGSLAGLAGAKQQDLAFFLQPPRILF